MPQFRVHFTAVDGEADKPETLIVESATPDGAANYVRKLWPGAIVHKTKLDKSGNQSPRIRPLTKEQSELVENIIEHFGPGKVCYGEPLTREQAEYLERHSTPRMNVKQHKIELVSQQIEAANELWEAGYPGLINLNHR